MWREGFRRFGAVLEEPAVTDDPVADFMAQGYGYRRFGLGNPHLYRVMFGDGLLCHAPRGGARTSSRPAARSSPSSLASSAVGTRVGGRWTT